MTENTHEAQITEPQKKKVAIVADTYYPKIDGIMRFLSEIVPRLKEDIEITLVVPDYHTHEEHFQDIPKVKIKVSRLISLSGYAPMRLSWNNFKKIREAVKNADIVFIQGPALISYVALIYSRIFKKRIIQFVHMVMWEVYEKNLPRWLRWTKKILQWLTINHWYNKCTQLVVPYKDLAHELTEIGVKTEKVIARLGVDTLKFIPTENKSAAKQHKNIDSSKLVIGYVGRISKEKNVRVLVEAYERLKSKFNCILLIVGSGTKEEMSYVRNIPGVVCAGFQENVIPYFQAMDIFVMPSLTETTSLATLEAMACGVPVVTTRVGFLKQYVRKDYNGLMFPRGNTGTLVLQLDKLLRSPEKRKLMGENARGTAMIFSWDVTAERLREILK